MNHTHTHPPRPPPTHLDDIVNVPEGVVDKADKELVEGSVGLRQLPHALHISRAKR